MSKTPMTLLGFQNLEAELKQLKTQDRQNIIRAIADARALGDLSENAEYHAAREKQGFIEGRIADIEAKLSKAEVIDPVKMSGEKIMFSATVTIVDNDNEDKMTYQIVGMDEADLARNKLSYQAPLARALIGKSNGDSVEVRTPKGLKVYDVLSVRYA